MRFLESFLVLSGIMKRVLKLNEVNISWVPKNGIV